jgi:hypothetical protein
MVQDIIWKSDCHSVCQKKYPAFLWNRVHTGPPLDPMLSQPNPVRPIDPYLPKVHLNVILPPMPRSSLWSLAFGLPNQNPVSTSPLPHACHMSLPSHPPWFNHPNNIRWRIQTVKFIIMQFSSRSVFIPFRSKYPPQHSVLKNPQSVFLPQSERPSCAPIQHNWKNQRMGKEKYFYSLRVSWRHNSCMLYLFCFCNCFHCTYSPEANNGQLFALANIFRAWILIFTGG